MNFTSNLKSPLLCIQWYHKFLVDKLCDINVEIGSWSTESSTSSSSNFASNCETQILRREVHSYHPSKITFPGLPSHAEVSLFHHIEEIFLNLVNHSQLKPTQLSDTRDQMKTRPSLKKATISGAFRTVTTSQ